METDEILKAYRKYKRAFRDANNEVIHNIPHCIFCGRVIHDYDLDECGYSQPDRKGAKAVFWHVDCYCRVYNLTHSEYVDLMQKRFREGSETWKRTSEMPSGSGRVTK